MSDVADEASKLGFNIGWWNSHLTPPGGKKLPDTEKPLVLKTIEDMLSVTAIFFLGEVDQEDMDWLEKKLENKNLTVIFFRPHNDNSKFNLGVIYRNDLVLIENPQFRMAAAGGSNYKLAVQVDAKIFDMLNVRIFVSHWPSRLLLPDEAPNRITLGHSLRSEIDSSFKDGWDHLILLGDYNEEPYNQSMRSMLRASRDSPHVFKKKELLYNPFWTHISCPNGYSRDGSQPTPIGTYYYSAADLHKWLVFDQMLFSHSFVGGSDWHLVQQSVTVYRDPDLVRAVESRKFKLDHLPILAGIIKD